MDKNMLNEFRRLSGIKLITDKPINENDFIPGLSDSDYGLAANVAIAQLTKELKGSDEEIIKAADTLYNTILHNKDVVSIINKLEKPEVIHMIEILKENPKELKRLINNI